MASSNFSQIPDEWRSFKPLLFDAEAHAHPTPRYAATLCRQALEQWVGWLFEHDGDLDLPTDRSLNGLLHEPSFRKLVAPMRHDHLNLIRKLGNTAVHTTERIRAEEAAHAVRLLHGFVGWVVAVYDENGARLPEFDPALLPVKTAESKLKEDLRELEKQFRAAQTALEQQAAELDSWRAVKAQNIAAAPIPHDPNEALTRKMYIDLRLRESGWNPDGPNVAERPVVGMPTADGKNNGPGFVDYVLWGDDGLPLAVVEAKRTSRDARAGEHQSKLYGDCLETEFGQRPVLFYTNGYRIWLWDNFDFVPREVFGFYTKDELQTLVHRRRSRLPLENAGENNGIADRYTKNWR